MEELFLRAFLAGDELDVVDEEHVDPPVALAKLLTLLSADRIDEFVRELFARRVRDPLLRVSSDHRVADRVHQMRLSETRSAVHEQRVVAVSRPLGDRKRRSVSEAVVRAHDEGREGVARVQKGAGLAPLLPAYLLAATTRCRRGHTWGRAGPGGRGRTGRCHEPDVDGAAEEMLERGAHLGPKFALQPLAGKCVGYADEKDVVLFGDDLRVLEPGVVLSARKSDLQLTEGGRPKLFEVQRLPFSTYVLQDRSPQPSRHDRPTPHRRERPKLRPTRFGSPRTIPQGEATGSTAMLVCTHRRFLIVLLQREKGLDLEAHLSTEDPPTCARAWISLAHEDDRRSSCARRAPRAWPQAPHRRLTRPRSWTPLVCGGTRRSPRCGAKE